MDAGKPRPAAGASRDLRIGGRRSSSFFKARDPAEFFQRVAVIGSQHVFLLNRGDVLNGDFYAIHRAQDAAAHFVERLGELLDFAQRFREQFIETSAERGVVRGHRGQDAGMIKRIVQPALQFAHAGDDARIDQRIEVAISGDLLAQGIEVAQQLHVLFGKLWDIGIGKNFYERDFEWRQRQCSIESIALLLPLPLHTRMSVEKSRDQIGFVAVYVAWLAAAHKVAKQGFGNFGVRFRRQRLAQHGGGNRHIEHVQPAVHAGERFGQVALGLTQCVRVESAGNRHVPTKLVAQELLIETLDRSQNCQLKFKIFGQKALRGRVSPSPVRQFFTAVSVKTKVTSLASYYRSDTVHGRNLAAAEVHELSRLE